MKRHNAVDKMVMAVIPRDEAETVLHALVTAGYPATVSESRGGVLRQSQYSVFIAVAEKDVENILTIIRAKYPSPFHVNANEAGGVLMHSTPETDDKGRIVVFVWDLDWFEII